jgi:hypothetical protein
MQTFAGMSNTSESGHRTSLNSGQFLLQVKVMNKWLHPFSCTRCNALMASFFKCLLQPWKLSLKKDGWERGSIGAGGATNPSA